MSESVVKRDKQFYKYLFENHSGINDLFVIAGATMCADADLSYEQIRVVSKAINCLKQRADEIYTDVFLKINRDYQDE